MYLVAIAWLYVALMMAIAEATHSRGSLLGAVITFLLYGLGPVCLVLYLMGTPLRRKARRAREAALADAARAEPAATDSDQPDAGRHAAADAVAPMRKEP